MSSLERNGRLWRPFFKQVVLVSRVTEGEHREPEVERNGRLWRPFFEQVVLVSRATEGEHREPEVERETSLELATSTLGRLRSTR